MVAPTFDAGANGDGLAAILATLAAQHLPGTFFLTGQFATSYPAAVRSIVAGGHRIGNHSMTHPYFTRKSDVEIRVELSGGYSAIRAAGGSDPRPLFRFPFGDRNARTIAAVNANGYACVRWTVDTLGWQGTKAAIKVGSASQRRATRVLSVRAAIFRARSRSVARVKEASARVDLPVPGRPPDEDQGDGAGAQVPGGKVGVVGGVGGRGGVGLGVAQAADLGSDERPVGEVVVAQRGGRGVGGEDGGHGHHLGRDPLHQASPMDMC